MSYTLINGYPTNLGQKIFQNINWTGPTLYATGGQALLASELGVGGIESVIGSVSQSGTYFAIGRPLADGAGTSVKICIFVCSSGAEAGALDLDAEVFNLMLICV